MSEPSHGARSLNQATVISHGRGRAVCETRSISWCAAGGGGDHLTRADLARPAAGLRVLLVEDETVIAFMVEDMLADLGADTVLHAASLERARALIAQSPPDLAVLDINLGRETCLPLAESLRETATPIVFASGYGAAGLPQGWEDAVIIQKPFRQQVLALALRTALLRARGEAD